MSKNKAIILRIICSFISSSILDRIKSIKGILYNSIYSKDFKHWGDNSFLARPICLLVGAKYITIGNNCSIGKYVQLTAWDKHNGISYTPQIIIGDNTSIGDFSHITAINRIKIGSNVLTGKNVLITDNSHGLSSLEQMNMPPSKRPLISKGEVVIEDNVWIGEKVSILPGVKIGFGSIIGTGSVVTHDIPPYSVAIGNPARVIKQLN